MLRSTNRKRETRVRELARQAAGQAPGGSSSETTDRQAGTNDPTSGEPVAYGLTGLTTLGEGFYCGAGGKG